MSISKSLHDSNKSVRLDKVGFVTDHSWGVGAGGERTTHPAVVSPAHDNTMTCDTVGKILMEFLVAPALTNGNSMQGLAVTDGKSAC